MSVFLVCCKSPCKEKLLICTETMLQLCNGLAYMYCDWSMTGRVCVERTLYNDTGVATADILKHLTPS